MTGTVYLIGAGPGAPDLLTLRAARLLGAADVVFYDALVHADTLALAGKAELVPVGKRCGRHSTAQRFINKRLIDAARTYPIVVRLKGGDPMMFGRSHEELSALRAAGIAAEVVPGVTAALAAAAELQVSLTRRGISRSVAFATPRVGEGEQRSRWADCLAGADTAVIYMGAGEAAAVRAALINQGRAPHTPVALCESVSLPGGRAVHGTIEQLPALAAMLGAGPTVILIGDVLREVVNTDASTQPEPQTECALAQRHFAAA